MENKFIVLQIDPIPHSRAPRYTHYATQSEAEFRAMSMTKEYNGFKFGVYELKGYSQSTKPVTPPVEFVEVR